MANKPPKIILYGVPGAGKDTHGKALADYLHLPHLSAGQLLREEVERGTPMGEIVKPHLTNGTLVPDWITTELLRQRVTSTEYQTTGYILNGYPRTIIALKDLLAYDTPTIIMHLTIPDEVARERMLERHRADDTPAAIETRIRRYHEIEQPVYDFIKRSTAIPFIDIDSTGDTDEVTKLTFELVSEGVHREFALSS